jgi:glutamate dehydrogenase (NAD(P)+)
VTVSYFEWLKNLQHVSFGRIAVSDLAHPKAPGSSELDYVRSALRTTMRHAYRELRELWRSRNLVDLRTAAYVLGIEKVAEVYESQGIFP